MRSHNKAIIFGSNGQDGHYLSRLFERDKTQFVCISRKGNAVNGDVGDYKFVEAQIKELQPTHIFHFAANSTTQHNALFENHQTICTGTLNILEAVKLRCPNSKVFITGSAMQFKNDGLPIDEQTPFEASSPYAVARIQSVYSARYYRSKFGLNVYVGFLFNHDSPLRTEQHINQRIVKTVKRIHAGSTEKLRIGNIDVRKEFNYAGDVVEAIWLLVNQDAIHEAVIGCGETHSIREWIEYCFNTINRKWREHVTIEEEYTPEYDLLVSNPKLIKSLGWQQKTKFRELADIMLSENHS